MVLIDLNEGNISLFEGMIDPDVGENIGREFYRGIVAINDEREPVGSMIWEYKNLEDKVDTGSEIFQINSEGTDALEALLEAYDIQNESNDVRRSFFELDMLPDEILEDLKEYGFSIDQTEGRDIIVTVADLKPLVAPSRIVPNNVVTLGEVSKLQFMQGVSTCLFKGHKGLMEDLEYIDRKWFDSEISSCVITDGKVSGMLLVHKFQSGTMMPVLLNAIGSDFKADLMYMIISSARNAYYTLPRKTEMIIRRRNEVTSKLTQRFFSNKSGKQVFRGIRE